MDKSLRARWVGRFVARLAGPLSTMDARRFSRALGSVQEARALVSDFQGSVLHFAARPARTDLEPLKRGLSTLSKDLDALGRELDRAEGRSTAAGVPHLKDSG